MFEFFLFCVAFLNKTISEKVFFSLSLHEVLVHFCVFCFNCGDSCHCVFNADYIQCDSYTEYHTIQHEYNDNTDRSDRHNNIDSLTTKTRIIGITSGFGLLRSVWHVYIDHAERASSHVRQQNLSWQLVSSPITIKSTRRRNVATLFAPRRCTIIQSTREFWCGDLYS